MAACASAIPVATAPLPWVRTPRDLNFLHGRGLTPTDKAVWHAINTGAQIQACGGAMSLPEIADYVECARSTVAESIARLEAAGVLTVERAPGKCAVYRTVTYLGPTHPPAGQVPIRQPDGSSPPAPHGPVLSYPVSRAREEEKEEIKKRARCRHCGGHGTDIHGQPCVLCGGKGWG